MIFYGTLLNTFEIQMFPDSCDQLHTNVCHVHVTQICEFIDDV